MFEKQKELQKAEIAVLQLIVVILVAIFVSFISDSDLNRTSIFILSLLHLLVFYISDYYNHFFQRGYLVEMLQTLKYSAFYTLAVTFASFIMEDQFSISRRGLIYFILMNAFVVYTTNIIIKRYYLIIYPNSKNSKRIFLITAKSRVSYVLERLETSQTLGGKLVAVTLIDDSDFQHTDFDIVPKEEIIQYATRSVIDEVFINIPSELYKVDSLISQFEQMGIVVNVSINILDFPTSGEKRIRTIADFNVVTFSTKFYNYYHVLIKRFMDIIGSCIGLIICGVIGVFLIPFIKRDGGPVIFAQKRVGKNGRIFKFYKFRSMYIDAEERKKDLLAQNTMTGGMFKVDDDPRITPIGRFIRKTSLDELPQFYNVLKGDMSLVGTRPPTVDEYEQYTPEQKKRLSFKPGITGLWQVSGRSQITDFNDVVKLDVAYIDGWTIWSDIKILLKTFKVVFMRDGAK